MNIEMMETDKLIPYENNPRNNESAVRSVAESIKQFGFINPIVIDDHNVIIAGHTRWKASQVLGLEKVPTLKVSNLNQDQINAYRLVDNRTNELADWDLDLLEQELSLIVDVDMTEWFGDDEEELDEAKDKPKSRLKNMELKAFEHYDYVVFVFRNTKDWLNIVNQFGLERVDAGYGETKKVGVGRVIDGKRLLEKIVDQNRDNQQREEQINFEEDVEAFPELD